MRAVASMAYGYPLPSFLDGREDWWVPLGIDHETAEQYVEGFAGVVVVQYGVPETPQYMLVIENSLREVEAGAGISSAVPSTLLEASVLDDWNLLLEAAQQALRIAETAERERCWWQAHVMCHLFATLEK